MVSLDVFRGDAFSTISLTTAVERNPFQPTGLGELGIFDPNPIRTTALAVEERKGKLVLIPFSDRGEEGLQRTTEQRKARYFDVPRLMHSDTIYASELQNIRQFGSETELMQLEAEVARRVNGPTGLTKNIEFTWEYQRLAAIQGLCLDADGSTKFDWFAEFGITAPAEIAFNLNAAAPAEGALRILCNSVVRNMARASQGAFTPQTQVYALCGDDFWDALVSHPDVTKTFYNWQAAAELRDQQAFQAMKFGGIYWFNYRGSDDATTIAVGHDKVKFFPVGAPGVFQVAWAPGESFEWVNTPGKPIYIIPIFDLQRNSWWKAEAYSYPLHICTRPEVLFSGRQGT
ncbi:MAG: major capsid protein [Caulobacteraceae bacterium]